MTKELIPNLPLSNEAMVKGYATKFSSGFATVATATGEWVYGFAATSVDNSLGTAGDEYIGIVVEGIMNLSSYVADTDAAGLYSSAIVIGDELTIGMIGSIPYVVKNAFSEDTSVVVGYALEANAGSTSEATIKTIAVNIINPKVIGSSLSR